MVDQATVTVNQESVDLEGGLPKRIVATAIVRQTTEVSATLREYSRRNINLMLGNGVTTDPTPVATTVGANAAAAATTLTVVSATGLTAGDLIIAYNVNKPEDVQVLKIASIATNVLTLVADTPVLVALVTGAPVMLAQHVPIGAVTATNYFAAMVIGQEFSTGAPTVWNFWKCAVSSGLNVASNSDDFASTDFTMKSLEPAASEYAVGGVLEDLAAEVIANPTGFCRL
jgi:hypothetical protein